MENHGPQFSRRSVGEGVLHRLDARRIAGEVYSWEGVGILQVLWELQARVRADAGGKVGRNDKEQQKSLRTLAPTEFHI